MELFDRFILPSGMQRPLMQVVPGWDKHIILLMQGNKSELPEFKETLHLA